MRPMMRLLLVGVLLCLGQQVSKVQPVYADNWQPGNYTGFFELFARSYTEQNLSGNGGSITFTIGVNWKVKGRLTLKITDAEHAVLTIENVPPVRVQHAAFNDFSAGGKGCTWWDNMDGTSSLIEARPLSQSDRNNNFSQGKFILGAFWDSPVKWTRVDGSSFGSIEGCAEKWGPGLAKAQQQAVDQMIKQLNEISFRTVFYGPDMIGGPIFLPKWEGVTPIEGGSATRTVKEGSWRVYRQGTKEWKKWIKK